MKKQTKEITIAWNGFVETLLSAREAWVRFAELVDETPREFIEEAPIEVQRGIGKFRKNAFSIVVPKLVDHWTSYGGIEGMLAEMPKKTKEKEVSENG